MKSEKLFDLLEHIDDRFIEDAMLEEFDEARPVEVRAEKPRLAPLRLIAPIAACLAVAICAGFVIANSGKFAVMPEDSVSTGSPAQNAEELTAEEETFAKVCQAIVTGESELIRQSETTWQTRKLDVDLDGEDELLIYPQIDKMPVPGVGVRVFKNAPDEVKDFGAFDLDGCDASLDDIYEYPEEDENAYYFYSESFDTSTPDGRDLQYIKRLGFDDTKKSVTTSTAALRVTEFGPGDGVTSVKNYIGENEVTETELYTNWMGYPNVPPIYGSFDYEDVKKCKEIAYDEYIPEKCVLRTVTIDSTPALLMSSGSVDSPSVFLFRKTDDGIERAGTVFGLRSVDDIKFYDELGESYWYTVTHSTTYNIVENEVTKTVEYTDVSKLGFNYYGLTNKIFLSFWAEHYGDDESIYKINDDIVTKEVFYKKLSKYYDCGTSDGITIADTTYPPIDMDDIPALSTYIPLEGDITARVLLTSVKYGKYEISLLSNRLYTYEDSSATVELRALDLVLLLSENGNAIYSQHAETFEAQYNGGFNKLDPNTLDKMLSIIELDGGTIVMLGFDSGEKQFFKLTENSIEPIIPTRCNNNRAFFLSDDYHIEGDSIIDNNTLNAYTFTF